jgi:hypothetical protein
MMLKSISLSRVEMKDSLSRTKHCNLLLIHKRRTYTRQQKKKTNRRRNKAKQSPTESVKIINIVHMEYDHLLISPYLLKQDDPGIPTIKCMINQRILHKTFCDTRSGVNIIAKVTYEYLFGKEPLYPTYVQLQMADQTF